MKRNSLVFTSETVGCAVFSFAGSVMGHRFGSMSLLIGGISGGLLGGAITTYLLYRRRVIEKHQYARTTTFGMVSFLVAAVLALTNLNTPVVPLVSLLLVGTGCLLGCIYPMKEESQRSYRSGIIGLLALLPALYFAIGSLVKYNLGVHRAFTLLDWFDGNAVRQHYFNLFSPVVFLGGLLLCLVLNGPILFHMNTSIFNVRFRGHRLNWFVTLTSGSLLTLLLLYVNLENARHGL